jgi:hypothetical protein
MGYFSNGSEGEHFEARWCDRCVNREATEDAPYNNCPIWTAHLFYCHDAVSEENAGRLLARNILGLLIAEEGPPNFKQSCTMFRESVVGDTGDAPKEEK